MKNQLSKFSTDQLLEELVRRRNSFKAKKPITPCDECKHFELWLGGGEPPDDYQPCAKGHAMSFREPDDPGDTNWGYYKRCCPDREAKMIELPDPTSARARELRRRAQNKLAKDAEVSSRVERAEADALYSDDDKGMT